MLVAVEEVYKEQLKVERKELNNHHHHMLSLEGEQLMYYLRSPLLYPYRN